MPDPFQVGSTACRIARSTGRLGVMVPRGSFLRTAGTAAILAVWLAALILPPVVLLQSRADWLAQLERPEAQSQWDAFRRDMRQQSGRDGPVQRKVPKSAEPPARVWLRDFFPLAVVAWVLFVGVLGGFFSLLVAGVLRGATGRVSGGGAGPASLAEDQPRRQRNDEKQHESDADDTQ
jgi:hypothetical protein